MWKFKNNNKLIGIMCAWWYHVETLAQGKEELCHVCLYANFTPRLSLCTCTRRRTAFGALLRNFPSLEMPLTDSSVNQPHTESREYRSSPPPEMEKSVYTAKSVPKSKNPDEVLYDDEKWYRGWLDSFNLRWVVKFQDDNETAEVLFPDKDVRLYNYTTTFYIHLYPVHVGLGIHSLHS